jgi:hypothetical protein
MTSRRRSNRDHAKKYNQPSVEEEVIAAQLEALLTPAIFNQSHYYRPLVTSVKLSDHLTTAACLQNRT